MRGGYCGSLDMQRNLFELRWHLEGFAKPVRVGRQCDGRWSDSATATSKLCVRQLMRLSDTIMIQLLYFLFHKILTRKFSLELGIEGVFKIQIFLDEWELNAFRNQLPWRLIINGGNVWRNDQEMFGGSWNLGWCSLVPMERTYYPTFNHRRYGKYLLLQEVKWYILRNTGMWETAYISQMSIPDVILGYWVWEVFLGTQINTTKFNYGFISFY